MKVVKPIAITTAVLISSTAVEAYAAYNAATAYVLNARCLSIGRVWECIQGPSTGNPPETSPLYWTNIGPSNTQAMFDSRLSTQTEAPASLTVVLKPGYVNSIGLFGLEGGLLTVTVRDALAGAIVYSFSTTLDGTVISDWYQYYFEPLVQRGEVVLTNLPPFIDAHITVTLSGVGTVKCGHLAVGTFYDLGGTQYGTTASIIDYSRKDTDAFGATTFVKRAYSKRVSARMMLANAQLNKVQRVLADLRATPCAWIGTDAAGFEPLTVFGFFRDMSIDVAYPTVSYCSVEIEGLS